MNGTMERGGRGPNGPKEGESARAEREKAARDTIGKPILRPDFVPHAELVAHAEKQERQAFARVVEKELKLGRDPESYWKHLAEEWEEYEGREDRAAVNARRNIGMEMDALRPAVARSRVKEDARRFSDPGAYAADLERRASDALRERRTLDERVLREQLREVAETVGRGPDAWRKMRGQSVREEGVGPVRILENELEPADEKTRAERDLARKLEPIRAEIKNLRSTRDTLRFWQVFQKLDLTAKIADAERRIAYEERKAQTAAEAPRAREKTREAEAFSRWKAEAPGAAERGRAMRESADAAARVERVRQRELARVERVAGAREGVDRVREAFGGENQAEQVEAARERARALATLASELSWVGDQLANKKLTPEETRAILVSDRPTLEIPKWLEQAVLRDTEFSTNNEPGKVFARQFGRDLLGLAASLDNISSFSRALELKKRIREAGGIGEIRKNEGAERAARLEARIEVLNALAANQAVRERPLDAYAAARTAYRAKLDADAIVDPDLERIRMDERRILSEIAHAGRPITQKESY